MKKSSFSSSGQGHLKFSLFMLFMETPRSLLLVQIPSRASPPWPHPLVPVFFLLQLLMPGSAHSEPIFCSQRMGTVLWRHVTLPKAFDDLSRPLDDQFTWGKKIVTPSAYSQVSVSWMATSMYEQLKQWQNYSLECHKLMQTDLENYITVLRASWKRCYPPSPMNCSCLFLCSRTIFLTSEYWS